MQKFLQFLVDEVLEGRGGSLKEYTIGVDVFNRGEHFDPRTDTIVRAEARKLRSRLKEYYETRGAGDPVKIEFNRGSYAPVFRAYATETGLERIPQQIPAQQLKPTVWHQPATLNIRASKDAIGVVVLPFSGIGGQFTNEFADGLTQELITSIGHLPESRVVSHTSALQFRGSNFDIRQIGLMLNASHAIEGSVRFSTGLVRISAQLVDTLSGFQIWSKSYDCKLTDSLVLQHEVANSIVLAVSTQLGIRHEGADITSVAPKHYIQGCYFMEQRTPHAIQSAIEQFEYAIAADGNFAAAFAGLATCYALLPVLTATEGLAVAPKIREFAAKAMALDKGLSDAYRASAVAHEYEFNWARAEEAYRVALRLNPVNTETRSSYANFLARIGRTQLAVEESRKAFDADPISRYAAVFLGRALSFTERFDEAREQFQLALSLDPNFGLAHAGLGKTYTHQGRHEEGIRALTEAHRILEAGPFVSAELGYAHAVAGNRHDAQRILEQLDSQSRHTMIPAVAYAVIYIGLGDNDRAFAALNTAVRLRNRNLHLLADPVYNPLKGDPRFGQLLHKMKLTRLLPPVITRPITQRSSKAAVSPAVLG